MMQSRLEDDKFADAACFWSRFSTFFEREKKEIYARKTENNFLHWDVNRDTTWKALKGNWVAALNL